MGWIEDNELRPEVQKLVDRFGQAQTFEILMVLAHSVCPDGANKISGSVCAWEGCDRVFDGRTLPEDWAILTLYRSKRPILNFLDIRAKVTKSQGAHGLFRQQAVDSPGELCLQTETPSKQDV